MSNKLTFNAYTKKNFANCKGSGDEATFVSLYCTANAFNYTTAVNLTLSTGTGFNVTSVKTGTKPSTNEWASSTDWAEGKQDLSWFKENDGLDYSFWYWGDNVNKTIYAITDEVVPNWAGLSQQTKYSTTDSYHTYVRKYYPSIGPVNEDAKVSRITCKYYVPTITPKSYSLKNITNSYVSNVAGETLCHGNGVPCFTNMAENGRIKIKNIKISMYNKNNTTPTTGKVKLMFSKNKFVDGTYATASDKLYEEEFNITASTGKGTFDSSVSFTVEGIEQMVWINVVDTTKSEKVIALESLTPVLDI